ncbi:MAG TPA: hypothetical protein VMV01_20720 [Planctomycetota bacterium]|nr:hypothetical protein [Planctomycetota bacterium]
MSRDNGALGPRMRAVAELVPPGARVGEVGTDAGALALALLDAGHPRAALAAMLGVVLDLDAPHGALDGYQRALAGYHAQLLTAAVA